MTDYSERRFCFTVKTIVIFLVFFVSPLLLCYSLAAVILVPADQSTIQAAINASFDADEIIVSPGTYYENIHFNGKNIILRSTDPTSPTVVASTIIDGGSADSVVTFSGSELTTCVLSGFTITNGYAPSGGGILGNATLATIQYNDITTNSAQSVGGGLCDCDGVIQNNTISQNVTVAGPGAGLYECGGTIQNNNITGNFAEGNGGGLAFCDATIQNNTISWNWSNFVTGGGVYSCDGTIQYNTITNNWGAAIGGGLSGCGGTIQYNTISANATTLSGGGLDSCNGTIQNNIISGNSTDCGGGLAGCDGIIQNNIISGNSVYDGGGAAYSDGTFQNNTIFGNSATGEYSKGGGLAYCNGTIRNCIVWQNTAPSGHQVDSDNCTTPSYSCIQDWTGGTGNISDDPLLADPVHEDFHLLSASPCIDAGGTVTLSQDFEGDPRPWDGTSEPRGDGSDFDIGADEFIGTAQPTPTPSPTPSPTPTPSPSPTLTPTASPTLTPSPTPTPCLPCVAEVQGFVFDAGTSAPIEGAFVMLTGAGHENSAFTDATGYYDVAIAVCTVTVEAMIGATADGYYGNVVRREITCEETNYQDFELVPLVSPTPTPGPPCLILVPEDYPTIQEAIDAAYHGCEIIVSPGTYYENIQFKSKNIVVRSAAPTSPTVVASTIIDGNNADSVVTFSGFENQSCALSGLTITHGYALNGGGIMGNGTAAAVTNNRIVANTAHGALPDGNGGGIYLCYGLIEGNTVQGNVAQVDGGGLYECDGSIRNNFIAENSAEFGGGLWVCFATIERNVILNNTAAKNGAGLQDCDGIIRNNIISGNQGTEEYSHGGGLYHCGGIVENNVIANNSAVHSGGGLDACQGTIQGNIVWGNSGDIGGAFNACNGIIQNNVVSGNEASVYGGAFMFCKGTIQNNTIWGNSSGYAGGGLSASDAVIKNCIIWNNAAPLRPQIDGGSTPSYSCIQDWTGGGTGNITDDPQLADPANEDLRLRPTSPCIDAGCSASLSWDFEGDPRPCNGVSAPRGDGSDFDIGADEYISPISFDFATSEEGWRTGSAVVFTAPEWRLEAGSVRLVAANNTNTFGFWVSMEDAIPANAGYLYRARFTVSTDVTEPTRVPQIRLRVNSLNLQQADYLTIESNGDAGASPTPTGTDYDLYFVPPANDTYCMLAFDLLNFDPTDAPDAEVALEGVVVERFALNTLGSATMTWTYEFETGQESWSIGGGQTGFTAPEFFWADAALHLRSTTNTNTFGYWHSSAADIVTTTAWGTLYRGMFEVRTDVTDQSRVPQMRVRFNTGNMQASRALSIESLGDGANSPTTMNRPYERLYFVPPSSCIGGGLIVSFDMLNFFPDDAASAALILDRATIEALSPPASP